MQTVEVGEGVGALRVLVEHCSGEVEVTSDRFDPSIASTRRLGGGLGRWLVEEAMREGRGSGMAAAAALAMTCREMAEVVGDPSSRVWRDIAIARWSPLPRPLPTLARHRPRKADEGETMYDLITKDQGIQVLLLCFSTL